MQLRWIINTATEVKGATEDMQATSVPSVIYSLFFFIVLWLCLRSLVSFIKEVLLSYYKLSSLILAFCLCRVLKKCLIEPPRPISSWHIHFPPTAPVWFSIAAELETSCETWEQFMLPIRVLDLFTWTLYAFFSNILFTTDIQSSHRLKIASSIMAFSQLYFHFLSFHPLALWLMERGGFRQTQPLLGVLKWTREECV